MVDKNGRIYPDDVMRREVDEFNKRINEGKAYGEIRHASR
jgi:hypothetical protein